MKKRKGLVYIGVLIACVVLAIGAFAFHHSMRGGRSNAYRSLVGEHAEMLARAGFGLAQAHLDRACADLNSELRRRLVAPQATLSAGTELGAVDLGATFPEVVRRLVRDVPAGTGVSLTARFSVVSVRDIPDLALSGRVLRRGEREKAGEIAMTCTARLTTGPFGEVVRTLSAVHEFRVVAGPVPFLSDFTAFLEDRPQTGGWGKPSPIAKLSIKNGDWKDGMEMDLAGATARGFVFLGDNERTAGRSERGYRPMLSREMLPASWGDALDRFEPGTLVLAELTRQIEELVCWRAPEGEGIAGFLERRGWLENGRLDLGTSVACAGALSMPRLASVRRGGVLMARQITITGPIPRPEQGVLVLIATDGPIRVAPGVPVHASLLALKGPVVLDGAPDIHGGLAAVRIDTGGLADGARLTYDPRLKERAFGTGATENLIVDWSRKPRRIE